MVRVTPAAFSFVVRFLFEVELDSNAHVTRVCIRYEHVRKHVCTLHEYNGSIFGGARPPHVYFWRSDWPPLPPLCRCHWALSTNISKCPWKIEESKNYTVINTNKGC